MAKYIIEEEIIIRGRQVPEKRKRDNDVEDYEVPPIYYICKIIYIIGFVYVAIRGLVFLIKAY